MDPAAVRPVHDAPAPAPREVCAELAAIEQDGGWRELRLTEPVAGGGCRVRADGRDVISFGSCDYLGLAGDARLTGAAARAASSHGAGAGAARLLTGHGTLVEALEQELAEAFDAPAALVFGAGYLANLGVIGALAGRGDLVVSDRLGHASTVDACRLSGARVEVFEHDDLDDLSRCLAAAPRHRRVVVAVEGLYSMDGDAASLAAIAARAREACPEAFLVVDDAHGFGTRGPGGRGSCHAAGIALDERLVRIGNLGKALGSYGAFVLASREVRELLVQRARSFIFTCALPPAVLGAARAGLEVLRRDGEPLAALRRNVARLSGALERAGVPLPARRAPDAPIVPVVLGSAERALAASRALLGRGWLVPAVRPPTVPPGSCRLRLTVTALHESEHLDAVAADLAQVLADTAHRAAAVAPAPADAARAENGEQQAHPARGAPSARDGHDAHDALRALDRRVLWHPFTQMRAWQDEAFPVVVAGEGAELIDAAGRRYLDGTSSLWCAVHGHRVPQIDRALAEQLGRVAHSTLLGLGSEPSIRLADELVAVAPGALRRVFYSDSGSSAVEVALKMAFQACRQRPGAEGRTTFLRLEQAYHGDTLGAVSVGGIDLFHEVFRPLLFETLAAPVPVGASAVARAADVARCLHALDALLAEHAHRCCALVLEPGVQGAAGMRVFPAGFTRAVAERARAAGLLVIADEVATGFGRSGELFACEREGIEPDLLCLGKALSGGYLPLAATLATEPVYEAFLGRHEDFRTFFHGHTFTGNALGCAAGRASLALCTADDFLPRARRVADELGAALAPLAEHPHVLEVRRYGSMVGIELAARDGRPLPVAARTGHQVVLAARERGVLLRPLGDVVVLMPPLCASSEQVRRLVAVTAESIDAVTATAAR